MTRSAHLRPAWLALAICLTVGGAGGAHAQGISDGAKAVAGAYEISNADRDKTCTVTLKAETSGANLKLELERKCAMVFPLLRDVAVWAYGSNDAIRLMDARAKPILEFTEVESGLYEGLRPGEPLYFMQSLAAATGDRTAEQMFGDWSMTRGGNPMCQLTLTNTATGPERFALKVKPGCDAGAARLLTWQMDHGQLVLVPGRGEPWRFEETDEGGWSRIPEGRPPIALARP
jgi:hypothetical protein